MPHLRFVHAADLHLDSPFVGVKAVADNVASALRDATFSAYENIIDLCIDEQVDALLVAGRRLRLCRPEPARPAQVRGGLETARRGRYPFFHLPRQSRSA